MANMSLSRADFLALLIRVSVLGAFSYFTVKYLIDIIDPTKKQKKEAQEKAERLLSRLGIENVRLSLSEYELSIAAQLVDPQSIDVCWADIAGLSDVIEDIKATIILPLRTPELFSMSKLHQAPKGVLLHGPPGCGKTMIAKATAKEAGARFINLEVPALTDKWYGESQKLAAAVFTLAIKLQPCIIFIDEIDSFLRSRDTHDHEATAMMKAQFMILWDGLVSSKHCKVIVMGATNRPQDVDKAILRRMPSMFKINLPTKTKRIEILELVMQNEHLSSDLNFDEIGNKTDGFSGSDLNELCRGAAMVRVREYCTKNVNTNGSEGLSELRPICMRDFVETIVKMKNSKSTLTGQTMSLTLD